MNLQRLQLRMMVMVIQVTLSKIGEPYLKAFKSDKKKVD